jgi:hypothetical protein
MTASIIAVAFSSFNHRERRFVLMLCVLVKIVRLSLKDYR